MSLCRIAVRRACVLALKGRTLAGDNVLDSEIGAVEIDHLGNLAVSGKGRFIAVYTDQATGSNDGQGSLYDNGKLLLRIEFGITEQMLIDEDDPDNPGQTIRSVVPGIPFTSSAAETYLDLLGAQIVRALSDPKSAPADIFRGLFQGSIQIDRRRESDGEGQAVAAQQIALTGVLLPDPITEDDAPDGGPFSRLLALLEAGSGDDQRVAGLMRSELKASGEAWEQAQERLGLTNAALLGLAGDTAQSEQPIASVVLDIPGRQGEFVSGGA
ncbi:hypothetical protein [Roseibium algae]|uniref:Uncharacterized protein n=1 Tax=Roseibium algae TaxID=3123038 RepID=A0ABU8TJX8_9HYPH